MATFYRFKHTCCFTIEKSDSFCLGHQPGPDQGKITSHITPSQSSHLFRNRHESAGKEVVELEEL